jgi:hypothetical protein
MNYVVTRGVRLIILIFKQAEFFDLPIVDKLGGLVGPGKLRWVD